MIQRGSICWAGLGEARGSRPAKRAPCWSSSPTPFNASRLNTVITSNTALAAMPGNVFVPAAVSGLPKDSVVNVTALITNVTALITLNKADLGSSAGQLSKSLVTDAAADCPASSVSDRTIRPERRERTPGHYPLRICSLRMSACPPCWASSRSTWRYTQRSGSGPRQ